MQKIAARHLMIISLIHFVSPCFLSCIYINLKHSVPANSRPLKNQNLKGNPSKRPTNNQTGRNKFIHKKPSEKKSFAKPDLPQNCHPTDCACLTCEKCDKGQKPPAIRIYISTNFLFI